MNNEEPPSIEQYIRIVIDAARNVKYSGFLKKKLHHLYDGSFEEDPDECYIDWHNRMRESIIKKPVSWLISLFFGKPIPLGENANLRKYLGNETRWVFFFLDCQWRLGTEIRDMSGEQRKLRTASDVAWYFYKHRNDRG